MHDLLFTATLCGKDQNDKTKTIGNDETQINIESLQETRGGKKEKKKQIEVEREEVIVVYIDWKQIFVDDEKYDDLEKLRGKIITSKCEETEFVHKGASEK